MKTATKPVVGAAVYLSLQQATDLLKQAGAVRVKMTRSYPRKDYRDVLLECVFETDAASARAAVTTLVQQLQIQSPKRDLYFDVLRKGVTKVEIAYARVQPPEGDQ